MNAYIVMLIGLISATILISVYGYLDYREGGHVEDMYNGLRKTIDTLKERLRILEDTVNAMNRDGIKMETTSNETNVADLLHKINSEKAMNFDNTKEKDKT